MWSRYIFCFLTQISSKVYIIIVLFAHKYDKQHWRYEVLVAHCQYITLCILLQHIYIYIHIYVITIYMHTYTHIYIHI